MARMSFGLTGEKVVELDCDERWECAELQSVDNDLGLAKRSLAQLEPLLLLPRNPDIDIAMGALWTFALVRYYRCFGKAVRRALDPTEVFAGQPEYLEDHQSYVDERNKNTVHSVNPLEDFTVGVRLVPGSDGQPTVQGTGFGGGVVVTGDQVRASRLDQLIDHVRAHVENRIQDASNRLQERARRMSSAELLSLPAPSFENAGVESVKRDRRQRPKASPS